MRPQPQFPTNYRGLTEFSKALNQALGDKSGRTVSTRTAHGFIKLFKAQQMNAQEAEFFVHSGMVAAGTLIKSNDEGARLTGFGLSFALFLCYHAGK